MTELARTGGNFFQRIVMRARGEAELVSPRLPARFEPTPDSFDADLAVDTAGLVRTVPGSHPADRFRPAADREGAPSPLDPAPAPRLLQPPAAELSTVNSAPPAPPQAQPTETVLHSESTAA